MNADEEAWILMLSREKAQMDEFHRTHYAIKEAVEAAVVKIAKKLKDAGADVSIIMKATGLSEEEIAKL